MFIMATTIVIWGAYLFSLYLLTFWLLTLIDKGLKDNEKELKEVRKVTVAIPVYNEEKNVKDTIESVLNLEYPHEMIELIVVNDGSKDNTENVIKSVIEANPLRDIKLISQVNKGKGAALNNALKLAKGELFTCLDADSFIEKSALRRMVPYFEESNVGVVLPLMKVKDPKGILQRVQWCEYLMNLFYKGIMGKIDCVHVAPGPFSVYRKSALVEVNGFAENNLTEDFEISLKLQEKDYRLLQLLGPEVYTIAPNTIKGFYKQRNRWYKGTMMNLFNYKRLIFNKKYGDFGMLQLPRIFISGFLAVSLLLMIGYKSVLKPYFKWMYDMFFVRFDVIYFFKEWLSNFMQHMTVLDINYTSVFLASISIILSLVVIRLSFYYTKEKYTRYGMITIPAYMALYGIMASFVWLGVFLEMVFKKNQKW